MTVDVGERLGHPAVHQTGHGFNPVLEVCQVLLELRVDDLPGLLLLLECRHDGLHPALELVAHGRELITKRAKLTLEGRDLLVGPAVAELGQRFGHLTLQKFQPRVEFFLAFGEVRGVIVLLLECCQDRCDLAGQLVAHDRKLLAKIAQVTRDACFLFALLRQPVAELSEAVRHPPLQAEDRHAELFLAVGKFRSLGGRLLLRLPVPRVDLGQGLRHASVDLLR